MSKLPAAVSALSAAAFAAAVTATAAGSNAVAYRAQVNAICRSYTPRFHQLESDMTKAKSAGDVHRYAYDLGVVLALTLKQGLRVERTPVPADARARMTVPLRLLHAADLQLRRTLTVAVNGDSAGFVTEAAKLAKVAAPLNRSFDAAGLRDCGSNQ